VVPPPVVLIHGSTQSASCWELVRTYLEQAGHATTAVDLPADRPDASATEFAHIVVDQIRSVSGDCVVVAHSASGILLPRIAQLRPVAALVYLAAVIPVSGMSVMDQFAASPDMFDPEWVRAGPRWSDPANWRELADRFLFHDVLDSVREWAHSTVRPMRIETALREPLDATEGGSVRSLCVPASRDRAINPEWQNRIWKERAMGLLSGTSTGHAPHVASPRETAAAIESACDAERWERTRQRFEELKRVGCPITAPPERNHSWIDYDTFADQDLPERHRIFSTISPENCADVVRTQMRRWLELNRPRLTSEQIEVLEESIAYVKAELYQLPKQQENEKRKQELLDRMFRLFTREEMWQAGYMSAPKIPG
jgi:pimeloyl-ACP methyl ester carboxylesterase